MRKTMLALAFVLASALPAAAQFGLPLDDLFWGRQERPLMPVPEEQEEEAEPPPSRPPSRVTPQWAPAPVPRQTAPAKQFKLPTALRRQERVELKISGLQTGDIFIDRGRTLLYFITGPTTAVRYGIGVGGEGFGELTVGEYYIARKQENPWWYPPKEMQRRDKNAAMYPNGMSPGPGNPLGVRALYLYNAHDKVPNPQKKDQKANEDSLFRIHGTNAPRSIGTAASSGCFRMLNEDVIDLYNRVQAGALGVGTRVVVR